MAKVCATPDITPEAAKASAGEAPTCSECAQLQDSYHDAFRIFVPTVRGK